MSDLRVAKTGPSTGARENRAPPSAEREAHDASWPSKVVERTTASEGYLLPTSLAKTTNMALQFSLHNSRSARSFRRRAQTKQTPSSPAHRTYRVSSRLKGETRVVSQRPVRHGHVGISSAKGPKSLGFFFRVFHLVSNSRMSSFYEQTLNKSDGF